MRVSLFDSLIPELPRSCKPITPFQWQRGKADPRAAFLQAFLQRLTPACPSLRRSAILLCSQSELLAQFLVTCSLEFLTFLCFLFFFFFFTHSSKVPISQPDAEVPEGRSHD